MFFLFFFTKAGWTGAGAGGWGGNRGRGGGGTGDGGGREGGEVGEGGSARPQQMAPFGNQRYFGQTVFQFLFWGNVMGADNR